MQIDANDLPGGLILLDDANRVRSVNQPFCDWLGRTRQELTGKPPESWMTRASRMYYLGHVLPSLRLHHHAEEVLLSFSSASGHELPVVIKAARCSTLEKGYQLLILPMQRRDLIEKQLQQARKTAEQATAEKAKALQEVQSLAQELEQRHDELTLLNEQLEQLATRDSLTGLNNRRVYDREMNTHLAMFQRTKTPFALVLADIDWFKDINDRFGHDAGDQILKDVSQSLGQCMRNIDTLVRMGGEEFALILPDTSLEQAVQVAERKRSTIEQLVSPYSTVTLSFGVAAVQTGDTKGALYGRADRAMYLAKNQGRNRVCAG
ncbi:MAG: diguanylate cyclase [Natronospirillum sp.]